MANNRKDRLDLWSSFLQLANNDDKLVRDAATRATDEHGRLNLKAIRRNILDTTNPALLATVEAASEFSQKVECKGRLVELPHLKKIYDLAVRDTTLPRKVFNDAVQHIHAGHEIHVALDTAIHTQNLRLTCH